MSDFTKYLLKVSRLEIIDEGKIEETFRVINEIVTSALGIDRCSVWLYSEQQDAIVCHDLYERGLDRHSSGVVLKQKDYPIYFEYIRQERTLSSHDTFNDPNTVEFIPNYFTPYNIRSMLDSPIWVRGKMVGVVCCEHTGEPQAWTIEHEIFIANITDILSRAFIAKERLEAYAALAAMNANLEKLVEERTRELEQQRIIAVNSSKMATLGEMAGSIAHEINNPLGIIVGLISVLRILEKNGELTQEVREEKLQHILDTSLRIDKIVKGLRFFARDSSKDSFVNSKIKQIIEDTIALCGEKFRLKGLEIIVGDISDDIELYCQPVSISQAILNLLGNSYDALEDHFKKWVKIECHKTTEYVEIRVTDSGNGIPPELREKILNPFYTTKPVGKGTGLGLPIVKGIVEQHNGTFILDTANPHTSFVMRFKHER